MEKATDKKTDDLLKRPQYVYDLPHEVLDSLILKEDQDGADQDNVESLPEKPSNPVSRKTSSENLVGAQACTLCNLSFSSVQDQRGHARSDFHNYNLRQKSRGRDAVSENEFEALIENLDESLSGSNPSEEEDEDEADPRETTLTTLLRRQATIADRNATDANGDEENDSPRGKSRGLSKAPLILLTSNLLPANTYFGVYRAIFTPEETKGDNTDVVDMLRKKQLQPLAVPKPGPDGIIPHTAYNGPHIFLCMIGGGHFAAMVIALPPRQVGKHGKTNMNREAVVLAQKTFHRYTTRRKQGGSQSANDNAKGKANSAGSTIRRYNEQALVDEVRLLLNDWRALIDTSELLFIRATGATNRRTLYGPYEDQVLQAKDPRIRGFPFSTKRATKDELMRSFIELTRLKIREIDPTKTAKPSQKDQTKTAASANKPSKPSPPKLTEEEETAQLHTSQLQAFIRRSKKPALLSYLSNNQLSPDFLFQPPDTQQNHHAPTPLHLASSHSSPALVSGLLLEGGADPRIRSAEGKTAFELAGDRSTRDAFRVARHELGEAKWDWDDAGGVGPALARADADRREAAEKQESDRKESERRKAEEEKLRKEEVPTTRGSKGGKQGGGGSLLSGGVRKSAQEKREEETRGLTPQQKMKLDRELRARAAERRFQQAGGGGS